MEERINSSDKIRERIFSHTQDFSLISSKDLDIYEKELNVLKVTSELFH